MEAQIAETGFDFDAVGLSGGQSARSFAQSQATWPILARPKIFVAETCQATRSALSAAFREEGYEVYAASGFHEGCVLAKSLQERPSVAVLGFRLRDGYGDQLASVLRHRWPDLLTLYFTGVAPDDDAALKAALGLPDTALIAKPASLDALLEVMRAGMRSEL